MQFYTQFFIRTNDLWFQILVANEMACELFGYDETEMIGLLLKDLVKLKPKDQATILESHLELTGEVVDIAGKVVGISLLTSGETEGKRSCWTIYKW